MIARTHRTLPAAEQVTLLALAGSQGFEARAMAGFRAWRADTAGEERGRGRGWRKWAIAKGEVEEAPKPTGTWQWQLGPKIAMITDLHASSHRVATSDLRWSGLMATGRAASVLASTAAGSANIMMMERSTAAAIGGQRDSSFAAGLLQQVTETGSCRRLVGCVEIAA